MSCAQTKVGDGDALPQRNEECPARDARQAPGEHLPRRERAAGRRGTRKNINEKLYNYYSLLNLYRIAQKMPYTVVL